MTDKVISTESPVGPEKREGGLDAEVLKRGAEEICAHMHLFPNRDHLEAWVKAQKDELGVSLNLEDVVNSFAQIVLAPFLK